VHQYHEVRKRPSKQLLLAKRNAQESFLRYYSKMKRGVKRISADMQKDIKVIGKIL
jgi:hypothetical protein